MLVAGFPCIDISRAGLRKGFDGQVNMNQWRNDLSGDAEFRIGASCLPSAARCQRQVPTSSMGFIRERCILFLFVVSDRRVRQVEALLDRGANGVPYIKTLADTFEVIGYSSWAHRVICSAGPILNHSCTAVNICLQDLEFPIAVLGCFSLLLFTEMPEMSS